MTYSAQPHTSIRFICTRFYNGRLELCSWVNKRNCMGVKNNGDRTAGPALHVTSTWPLLLSSLVCIVALQVGGCSKAALHPMPTFPSRSLSNSPLHRRLKKHPALFGVPFLLVMVGAS